MDEVDIGSR